MRTVSVVIIGNEILSGRTRDANTPWIAEKVAQVGVRLLEIRIVPDIEEHIISAVNELREKTDYVITTGGIGPTHDDITSESVAKAFGRELELNQTAYDMLEDHYGPQDFTKARQKMAYFPEDVTLIQNPVSAAPGFQIDNVFVLAGVPRIMQAMLDEVLHSMDQSPPLLSTTVACSLAESDVAEDVGSLQKRYPNIEIGSYPHFRGGMMGLSLVLRGVNQEELDQATQETIDIIRQHGDEPRAISAHSSNEFIKDFVG